MKRVMHGSWGEVPPRELFRAYTKEPGLIERDMNRLFDRYTVPHALLGYYMEDAVKRGDERWFTVVRNAVIIYKLKVMKEWPL